MSTITLDSSTVKADDNVTAVIPENLDLNNLLLHEPSDYLNKWDSYRITSESEYPTPLPIISINGESIATSGNIMAISGVQKSGKSSISNIILSGTIREVLWDGVPEGKEGIEVQKCFEHAVIHIDTEQAKHRHLSNLKSGILKRVGLDKLPDNFYSYNTRGLDIHSAIEMLEEVFKGASMKHNKIHLALIDGIADFVLSVNDEEESNRIIKGLENLATSYNTLIIVVIHRNPNDSKIRGHLGSQLLRKCESILAIRKENDCSYIDPEELRTASKNDIPKYLFQFDKNKGYSICSGERKNETSLEPITVWLNFFNEYLKEDRSYTSREIKNMLCIKFRIGDDMANKKLGQLKRLGLLLPGTRGVYFKVSPLPTFENGSTDIRVI